MVNFCINTGDVRVRTHCRSKTDYADNFKHIVVLNDQRSTGISSACIFARLTSGAQLFIPQLDLIRRLWVRYLAFLKQNVGSHHCTNQSLALVLVEISNLYDGCLCNNLLLFKGGAIASSISTTFHWKVGFILGLMISIQTYDPSWFRIQSVDYCREPTPDTIHKKTFQYSSHIDLYKWLIRLSPELSTLCTSRRQSLACCIAGFIVQMTMTCLTLLPLHSIYCHKVTTFY